MWEMREKDNVMLSGTYYLPILTCETEIWTWTKRNVIRLYTAVSTQIEDKCINDHWKDQRTRRRDLVS